MKWFRRLFFWRKKPNANDQVIIDLETAFDKIEWAQSVMDNVVHLMDTHCHNRHRYLHECDILCVPMSLTTYLKQLPDDDLYYVAIVAMKYYYTCYAALRHERSK